MSVFDEENEISFYDGVPDDVRAKHEEWDKLIRRLMQNSESKGLPIGATFEITPLCNLSCKMCFIKLDKDKISDFGSVLTAEQWNKIAKETAELGVLSLIITGGEPFLHPEFTEIYQNIVKLGFSITLYTNAVMLNKKIIETLRNYPPTYLYITIYGASEETYEKLCGNGKSYRSVIDNIKILKNILKSIPIELRTTVVKENMHDIGALREFAKQMQLKFSFSFGTIKPIRGAEYRNIETSRLMPEEIIKIQKENINLIKNEKIYEKHKKDIEEYKERLKSKNQKTTDSIDNIIDLGCRAAKNTYTISWDGKMLPCQIFSSPYILPLNVGIRNAWNILKDMRKNIKIPNRCINCKYQYYCGRCPAIAQAESGTYLNNEPYKCMANI